MSSLSREELAALSTEELIAAAEAMPDPWPRRFADQTSERLLRDGIRGARVELVDSRIHIYFESKADYERSHVYNKRFVTYEFKFTDKVCVPNMAVQIEVYWKQ